MRTVVHLVEPGQTAQDPKELVPFNVIYDGEFDAHAIKAAHEGHRPIEINGRPYYVRDLNYDAVAGQTVVEVEVNPAPTR